jgi:hypothetical protein
MMSSRVLYQMVRADFLERVRRYSFLLILASAVYLGYATGVGHIVLRLDDYEGVFNSAWCGSMMTLVSTTFLTLVGFYMVKNTLQRDEQTRVGQILAATPMTRPFYTVAKMLSNLAVLGAMLVVMAIAALLLQLSRAGHEHVQVTALLSPFVWVGLPAMAFTAALAILFETIPLLRGGIGNVIYFFVWIAGLGFGINSGIDDLIGFNAIGRNMQAAVKRIDPAYKNGIELTISNQAKVTKSFLWDGVNWNAPEIAHRLAWLAIAVGIALVAALFFHRFDPARGSWKLKAVKGAGAVIPEDLTASTSLLPQAISLTPIATSRASSQLIQLVTAELRLAVKGLRWWWYLVAAGLFVACLFSPLEKAKGVLLVAWIWPILIWSQMGVREARWSTQALVFSSQHALQHQLPAAWIAGILVTAATGGGVGIRLLLSHSWHELGTWAVAVVFIPTLALACGIWSGSSKLFEALFTAWWYVGPVNRADGLDFVGMSPAGRPWLYLVVSGCLIFLAYAGRRRQMAYA